jgi:hypothetical protein
VSPSLPQAELGNGERRAGGWGEEAGLCHGRRDLSDSEERALPPSQRNCGDGGEIMGVLGDMRGEQHSSPHSWADNAERGQGGLGE